MKLFEVKDNIVIINIDIDIIRKFNVAIPKSKTDCGDYNEFLIDKLQKGNKDAVMKCIDISKKAFLKSGCSTYEQLKKR